MVIRLQVRHDTKANWEKFNPVLASGELGVETDNVNGQRIKIGDGNHAWADLSFIDENAVHKLNTESIAGLKTFVDSVTFSSGAFIPTGKVLNGVAENAINDEAGNKINVFYQKSLSNKTALTDAVDWNTIVEEGYYKVDLTAFGSYVDKHSPNEFKFDMNPKGLLFVLHNDTLITQMYIPYANSPLVYRAYDGTNWTTWFSIIAEDETVVHTTGAETISGIKTFTDNMILEGSINFDTTGDVSLTKQGSSFLKQESTGVVYLSSKQGTYIYIRPNGETSTDGQIIIDSQGVIDGKAKKDGNGNVISDTYARKDEMTNYAQTIGLGAIVSSKLPVTEPDTYASLVEMETEAVGSYTDVISDTISIPYKMTNTGIKIVDIADKDKVDSCYDNFNTANYFILDKTNQKVQFPYAVSYTHLTLPTIA